MIGRAPSLTEQVTAHLKERIAQRAFADGRIPPETELAADLGVSRTTVRDALSRLEHEGAIYRRQGAGTFVNPQGHRIRSRLEEIWSYERMLRDHGYTPSVRILGLGTEPATEDDVQALEIDPGSPVLVMEKLFLENADPVVLTANRIPGAEVHGEIAEEDAAKAIFDFLNDHAGLHLAYYVSDLVPVVLDAGRATLLGAPDGSAALSFDEIGYDPTGRPILRAVSYFRDDLVRFRLMRRRSPA